MRGPSPVGVTMVRATWAWLALTLASTLFLLELKDEIKLSRVVFMSWNVFVVCVARKRARGTLDT